MSAAYQARRTVGFVTDAQLLELKATIKARGGLLHNLIVLAAPDGTYEVCAGGPRRSAIGLLIDEGNHHSPQGSVGHLTPCEYVQKWSVQPKEVTLPQF